MNATNVAAEPVRRKCDECRRPIGDDAPVTCSRCVDRIAEQDNFCDEAHVGDEEDRLTTLRRWVDAQKMRGNLTPREVELFELAAEDIEVGKW